MDTNFIPRSFLLTVVVRPPGPVLPDPDPEVPARVLPAAHGELGRVSGAAASLGVPISVRGDFSGSRAPLLLLFIFFAF